MIQSVVCMHHKLITTHTDEHQIQVLIACLSSSPDCGENADNRIRNVCTFIKVSMWVMRARVCVTARVRKKFEIREKVRTRVSVTACFGVWKIRMQYW